MSEENEHNESDEAGTPDEADMPDESGVTDDSATSTEAGASDDPGIPDDSGSPPESGPPPGADAEAAGDETNGQQDDDKEKPGEMSFIDHLEELRWRIIYSLIGIIAGAVIVWFFKDFLMEEVLLRPAKEKGLQLQNLRPFGQVFLYMEVALFGGIILSIPNIIYQFWKFIAPGLFPSERKYIVWIVLFTSLCFLGGISFAYFAILPAAFTFFVHFGSDNIENIIAIGYYFEFVLTLMLGAGLIFELPMLSFFLSRLGLVTPKLMRKYWRHAMVTSALVAALLSPGPDPFSMLLMAIPLVFLYEISILISRLSQKKSGPRYEAERDE